MGFMAIVFVCCTREAMLVRNFSQLHPLKYALGYPAIMGLAIGFLFGLILLMTWCVDVPFLQAFLLTASVSVFMCSLWNLVRGLISPQWPDGALMFWIAPGVACGFLYLAVHSESLIWRAVTWTASILVVGLSLVFLSVLSSVITAIGRPMNRGGYALLLPLTTLIVFAITLWFLADYVSTGVADQLPEKNTATSIIAVFAFLLAGGFRLFVAPRKPSAFGLSLGSATVIHLLSGLLLLVALLRFVLPLSCCLGTLVPRPQLVETLFCVAVLWLCVTVNFLLPAFTRLPNADDVMRIDKRKPVLYLRSFEAEVLNFILHRGGEYLSAQLPGEKRPKRRAIVASIVKSRRNPFLDEQMILAQALERIGPYIAIGRPSETFRDMDLGAAKKYVSDDEWQAVVREWLNKSAAIVVEAGDSAGLGWEIDEVVRVVAPQRLLIICSHTDEAYESFLCAHGHRFPIALPSELPASRLLIFDEGWNPHALTNVDRNASLTLEPFFEQLGVHIDQS